MKIAILASEGAPYAKSGGLGDVMEALPAALSRIEGNQVVLILPYYKKIKENPKYEVELVQGLIPPAVFMFISMLHLIHLKHFVTL